MCNDQESSILSSLYDANSFIFLTFLTFFLFFFLLFLTTYVLKRFECRGALVRVDRQEQPWMFLSGIGKKIRKNIQYKNSTVHILKKSSRFNGKIYQKYHFIYQFIPIFILGEQKLSKNLCVRRNLSLFFLVEKLFPIRLI